MKSLWLEGDNFDVSPLAKLHFPSNDITAQVTLVRPSFRKFDWVLVKYELDLNLIELW